MKKIIVFILVSIIAGVFFVKQISGKNEELGISEPVCKSDFKSAGVYDETLGIHSLTCIATVSSEYNCRKWRFVIGEGMECLEEK